jgi:hypothetical protein
MVHDGSDAQKLSDTTPRAMARYWERLRETPPRERLRRALVLSEQVRAATMADVRKHLPGASEDEVAIAFVRRVYGNELADRFAARRSRR